jgi:predicted nucleotidyltransferase
LERTNRLKKEARTKELVHELGRIINALKKDKEIKLSMLFGSLARGDISATSDIDVIIVKGTKKSFSIGWMRFIQP